MEKLELKHLAPYLPYMVRFISYLDKPFDEYGSNPIWTLNGVSVLFGDYCLLTKENSDAYPTHFCKPILRPLSDLTKEIEHNGEPVQAYREVNKILNNGVYSSGWNEIEFNEFGNLIIRFGDHCPVYSLNMEAIPVINFLLSCHFDVFGLIEKGLAVDINTLTNPDYLGD